MKLTRKLTITRKMSDTVWRGSEAYSSYFVAVTIQGDKEIPVDFQLFVSEEEFNYLQINQSIEVKF